MKFDTWRLENAGIQLIDGDRGKNYPKQTDFMENGYCLFLSAKNVTPFGFNFSGQVYINREKDELLKAGRLSRGDIVVTTRGTIGNVVFYDETVPFVNVRINLGMMIFRADKKIWNRQLLYFLLTSEFVQKQIISLTSGSAVPQLPARDLKKFTLPKIPIDIQNQIAEIIGSVSDKIELNRQISQTLEHIAQTIFKSWFVDFEPVKAKIIAREKGGNELAQSLAAQAILCGALTLPQLQDMDAGYRGLEHKLHPLITDRFPDQHGLDFWTPETLDHLAALFPGEMEKSELGEAPKGWSAGKLGDLYSAKGGYAYKSKDFITEGHPVVKIKNITGTGTVNLEDVQYIDNDLATKSDRFVLADGDLVMAMTGATVGKTGIIVTKNTGVYLNQRVAKFESNFKDNEPSWFVFCLFHLQYKFEELVGNASGSAQPNISSSGIESTKSVVAPPAVVTLFNKTVDSLFQKWIVNNKENDLLRTIGDSLLPKLLSGEITLGDTQSTAEAVA